MKKILLSIPILFLITQLASATVSIIPSGEDYVGMDSGFIYISKDYFGTYIDFFPNQINQTHWNITFSINQSIVNDTNNCTTICDGDWNSTDCTNCWSDIKDTYLPDANLTILKEDGKNLSSYPIVNLTEDIKTDVDSINYLNGNGSFYLIFPNGFKSWQKLKMGFGTVNFVSGSLSPVNRSGQISNSFTAKVTPISNVSSTLNCSLYVDNILKDTQSASNNTEVSLDSGSLSDANHTWSISCTDDNWTTNTTSEKRIIYMGGKLTGCAYVYNSIGDYYIMNDIIADTGSGDCLKFYCDKCSYGAYYQCAFKVHGQGHSINGTGGGNGFVLTTSTCGTPRKGIIVENFSVRNFSVGAVYSSYDMRDCIIQDIEISDCNKGLKYLNNHQPEGTNYAKDIIIHDCGTGLTVETKPSNTLFSNFTFYNNTIGFYSQSGYMDEGIENSTFYNNTYGFKTWYGGNFFFRNNIFINNEYAFYLDKAYIDIYSNIIRDNSYGVYIKSEPPYGYKLLIYNNLFNQTNNTGFDVDGLYIYWNTTKQTGTRICGNGTIGGNYWTNSTGNGYSDTCTDVNKDGFCDNPYDVYNDTNCTVDCSNNIDFLPLSCQCSNWLPAGSCIDTSIRYYTRTCAPAGCNVEGSYQSDPSCFSEQYGTASVILPLLPLLLVIGIAIYIFKSAMLTYDDIIKILLTVLVAVALLGVMVTVIWF